MSKRYAHWRYEDYVRERRSVNMRVEENVSNFDHFLSTLRARCARGVATTTGARINPAVVE